MRESASTDLREPQGSNPLGPPGPELQVWCPGTPLSSELPPSRWPAASPAIALEHGPEPATGNTSHFQCVQQLGYSLTLVNWRI